MEFLQHMLKAVPYQAHNRFTDKGIQFAEQPRNPTTICSRPIRFDMICAYTAAEIWKRRKACLRKRHLKCRAVVDNLEETADRLFTFRRLDPSQ